MLTSEFTPKPITVRSYMAKDLITFTPEMDVFEAVQRLVQHKISGAPVIDHQGNLVGLLSELDCVKVVLNASYYGDWAGKVSEYMSHDVKTIDADTSIVEVAEMFLQAPYRRYPVLEENQLVGQISRRDVLRVLQELGYKTQKPKKTSFLQRKFNKKQISPEPTGA